MKEKMGSYEPAPKIERGMLCAMQGRRDEAKNVLREIVVTGKGTPPWQMPSSV